MLTQDAYEDSRFSFWPRVREYAVPPAMIESATARRLVGDWAGACAAAGFDVDLNLRAVGRTHGRALAAEVRADLRCLAPDLLRWHMPRIAPDGLLRPGLTVSLARYATASDGGSRRERPRPVHLVARTIPTWADAGQRVSLALWDGSDASAPAFAHPHARPNARFRLDLHRHLWDADRAHELRTRSGADRLSDEGRPPPGPEPPQAEPLELADCARELLTGLSDGHGCAVDRWADEARILLRAEGRSAGAVTVRLSSGQRLLLERVVDDDAPPTLRVASPHNQRGQAGLPLLPDAATWVPPDLELLRTGTIEPGRLHPLVAAALVPNSESSQVTSSPTERARLVECRGAWHRIGLVDGVLAALDHDPDELRREELLAALTGTPLPCLQAIDRAHRRPDCLEGVRERLAHGDTAGALAVVEKLLGPEAKLRGGPLRDALDAAARQRITYGLYRAGLADGVAFRAPTEPSRSGLRAWRRAHAAPH
ncbi:hypothetical protein LO772_01285 [Yinghuangia sp. ASG 101]|uniref:hypothetical protein n=1 Tax=Yinghuangia sp. ASG 101 TaxID=2896848 RepID=UPI001E4253B9|nr:hypothetical protein [Yinghuangia sp. ASG 101]UGQ12273.1 hypothetical protein LO772_01285 [Yinghuangia sp. ASG 101]